METDAQFLRARIRQLKLFLFLWLLVAVLYGTMFALTLTLHGDFETIFFSVALATTGAAVLDVIWIRTAKRQLRAIASA
jgi:hypothetical protein